MKRAATIFSLFLALVLVLGPANPSFAKKQVYDIDLVRFNLEDIQEPEGTGTIVVEFPDQAGPYIQQMLNDQITPLIVTANNNIKKRADLLQKEIDALQQDPTNEDKKNKVQSGLVQLNKEYDEIIVSTQKAAEHNLKSEWKKIQNENTTLKKHKIKVVFKVGKQAFSIATAVARLVASSGADVTGYVQIARSVQNLYTLVSTELEDLRTKQKKVMKGIESLKKAMDNNKGAYDSKTKLFKKYYNSFIKKPSKKLETAANELELKMIASRRNIQNLANTLNSLLEATEKLPEGDKRSQAEKKIDKLIKGIINKHERIEANAELVKFSKNLVDEAKNSKSKPEKLIETISENAETAKTVVSGVKSAIKYTKTGVKVIGQVIELFA